MHWTTKTALETNMTLFLVKPQHLSRPPPRPLDHLVETECLRNPDSQAYSWDTPNKIVFRSLSGNVMKTLDGSYTFTKQPRGTLIEYELAVQFPGFGVPDMIQKQISGIIAQTAVFELKEYIRKKTPRR
jgi:hypothetical protein